MNAVIVTLVVLLRHVQRYLRTRYDVGLRRQALALRVTTLLLGSVAVELWVGWCRYEPAGKGIEIFVAIGLYLAAYASGEALVRGRLRRAGVEVLEGPCGSLY